jgi:hypothetical protein
MRELNSRPIATLSKHKTIVLPTELTVRLWER